MVTVGLTAGEEVEVCAITYLYYVLGEDDTLSESLHTSLGV